MTTEELVSFFKLRSAGELRLYLQKLPHESDIHSALRRYAETWTVMREDEGSTFDPLAHVSEDLSAALYEGCPCIFMGSNRWATYAHKTRPSSTDEFRHIKNALKHLRANNPGSSIVFSIIPEKDYTINKMFCNNSEYSDIHDNLREFQSEIYSELNIFTIFDEYFDVLVNFQSVNDYAYPDSHLPTANYLQVVAKSLAYFGVSWPAVQRMLRTEFRNEYFDLASRLTGFPQNPSQFSLPVMQHEAEISLVGGSDNFEKPLANTFQHFNNSNPLDKRSVVILGDSHSSIFSKRKLTYLFAGAFSEARFYWNPCGIRPVDKGATGSLIFCQISQRFLFHSR